MEENEDLYRKLQEHIDSMPIPYPATKSGVELSLLRHLFSPIEAHVALCLSALPERLDVIYKRARNMGLGIGELEQILDSLVKRGAILSPAGTAEKTYGKLPLVIGMFEFQVNNLTKCYVEDFHSYMDEGFRDAIFSNVATKQMRTVPIGASLPSEKHIGKYDDVRNIMRSSNGPFAVANCVCREGQDILGTPCSLSNERELCLSKEDTARMYIRDGRGREISREQMLERLDLAENVGMVLQPENSQNPSFVCCCCGCCCEVLKNARKMPAPSDLFHTNYYARVSSDACTGCGTCVRRCQMEAIAVVNGKARVDRSQCIGCGLCVPSCKEGAVHLHAKEQITTPPRNGDSMYKKMFTERLGLAKTFGLVGKIALKKQI